MSIDRFLSYHGRHWALKFDPRGALASVHHFDSEEMRNDWVAMDPEFRMPVEATHKAVRRWINGPSWMERAWAWITGKEIA